MTPVQVALLRMNIYVCVDVLSEMLFMSVCQNVAAFPGMAFYSRTLRFFIMLFLILRKIGEQSM